MRQTRHLTSSLSLSMLQIMTTSLNNVKEEATNFPFSDIEESKNIELAIKIVEHKSTESIDMINNAIDSFFKTEHGSTPADKAIQKLANASVEMKGIVKKASYECSLNVYPRIIRALELD